MKQSAVPLTQNLTAAGINDRLLLIVGITAVFVGYFSVWLPGPAAGLRFIGVEMGEWIKFLGVDMSRNLFYLPPITLGLTMAWWTAVWPNRRWQTWVMRGAAVGISLLAFPAWEDFRGPAQVEYLPRIWLIGAVVISVLIAAGWGLRPFPVALPWFLIAVVGIFGLVLPTWITVMVRPVVAQSLQMSVGIGVGVWLNGVGHLLMTAVSLKKLA